MVVKENLQTVIMILVTLVSAAIIIGSDRNRISQAEANQIEIEKDYRAFKLQIITALTRLEDKQNQVMDKLHIQHD